MRYEPTARPGDLYLMPPTIPTAGNNSYEEWESRIKSTLDFEASIVESHFWLAFGDDPSPIEVQMINPEGQKTGFDLVTQRVFEQIRPRVIG